MSVADFSLSGRFAASSQAFGDVRALAADFAARSGLPAEPLERLTLVLEELFTNTVRHGYRGAEGTVRLRLDWRDGAARVTYEDAAPPFDTAAAPIDPAAAVAAGQVGGMGLPLIHRMASSLRYERAEGWNRTTLTLPGE